MAELRSAQQADIEVETVVELLQHLKQSEIEAVLEIFPVVHSLIASVHRARCSRVC